MTLSSMEKKLIYQALDAYIPTIKASDELPGDAKEYLISEIVIIQEKIKVDIEVEEEQTE